MTGGLAIIFGVDRILDMARTVVNITGDCIVASVVHHWEEKTSTTSDVST
jgi:proton glutamate symport protein